MSLNYFSTSRPHQLRLVNDSPTQFFWIIPGTCQNSYRFSQRFSTSNHFSSFPSVKTFQTNFISFRVKRQTLWGVFKHNFHLRCLILTILLQMLFLINFTCQATTMHHFFSNHGITEMFSYLAKPSICYSGKLSFLTVLVGIVYIFYMLECFHSTTRLIQNSKTTLNIVKEYIQKMRLATPIIWWSSACFSKMQTLRSTFRNGFNQQYSSQTELKNEHVLTQSFWDKFQYRKCGIRDISSQFPDLSQERCFAIRININKKFFFSNERSLEEFSKARNEFFERLNCSENDILQFEQGFDLEGIHFRDALIALPSKESQFWFASSWMFWLCSIFLLSWPLRIILEYNTIQVKYQIIKLFGENYDCDNPLTSPAQTSANFYMTPSYSECFTINHNISSQSANHKIDTSFPPSYSSLMMNESLSKLNIFNFADRIQYSNVHMKRSFTDRDIFKLVFKSKLTKPWTSTIDLVHSEFV